MRKSTKFKPVYLVMLLSLLLSLLPIADGGVALAGAGDLVPMGDQLGDVGQYYSQVSPNMKSRTYAYNTANASRTVNVALYSDTGTEVETLNCTVAANSVLFLRMNNAITGTLTLDGYSGGTNCSDKTGLHGVYHMKVWQTENGDDLAVSVNTWANDSKTVMGAYQAVPSWGVSSEYVLPAVLLGRSTGWDTEIVVQNTSGTTNTVTFSWVKDGESAKYNNNSAALAANERRIFLASQLLYADVDKNGTLVEKDGWAWMKVAGSGNLAVTTNIFKQGLTDGKYRAEYGSERFMQFEAPLAGTELFVPGFKVDGTNSAFRVANASGSTANLTMRLYNSSGTLVDTYSSSVASERAGYYASNVFGNASSSTYTLRISSTQNVTAAAWHSSGGGHTGVTAQRVEDTNGTATYLPFYWENFYSSGDVLQLTKTSSGSSTFTGHVCVRSTGSCGEDYSWTGVAQYAYRNVNLSGWSNELAVKASGSYPLTIGRFENYSDSHDRVISYNGIAKKSGTWYVPFAPAPVVPFAWSTSPMDDYPDAAQFGFSGDPTNLPAWASSMNWYTWPRMHVASEWAAAQSNCLKTNYLLMDKGPVDASGDYNSYNRLSTIRNLAPSACAGRPFLLANEPNFTDQANMTHKELARQVFVYRNWPGDLHSPAYGHSDWGQRPQIDTDYGYTESEGYTNPTKTGFVDFKNYYSGLVFGGNLPYDSLAVHFYLTNRGIDEGNYYRTYAKRDG